MSMMLFQALIAIELYTGKSTPVDCMKEQPGIQFSISCRDRIGRSLLFYGLSAAA